jgi:hypothetical protein
MILLIELFGVPRLNVEPALQKQLSSSFITTMTTTTMTMTMMMM